MHATTATAQSDHPAHHAAATARVHPGLAPGGVASEVLATVLHEMRTPLSSLAASVSLLQACLNPVDRPMDRPGVDAHLGRLQRNTAWLQTLVSNLTISLEIDAERLAIYPQEIQIADCLDTAIDLLRPMLDRERQRVVIEGDVDARAWGDAQRVEQILINLLSNASKYGGAGQDIVARLEAQDPWARIAIHDHGPGITPEDQGRIFDRWIRGQAGRETVGGGLGLGLHIARTLVELQGGTLEVESQPGHGAAFRFTLPRRPAGR